MNDERKLDELISELELEPAPDLWDRIRPNLAPRMPRAGFRGWIAVHRVHSAVAGAAAVIALAALLLPGPQPAHDDTQAYLAGHAAMSWREPFADKAVLGLTPIDASEAGH